MKTDSLGSYAAAWIALLILLALTCASSYVPMGRLNLVANIAIATLKALLVAVAFMKVLKGGPVVVLTALSGVVWLAFLAILGMNDFVFRGP